MAILLIAVGLPTVFYMLLSTNWAQERLRQAADQALERVLGTEVEIGSIGISPFTRLWLSDITINDDNGTAAMSISRAEARIELIDLIIDQRVIIDYIDIEGLDARISRPTPETPLNIANILQKLSSDDTIKREQHFDLRLNDVSISDSRLSYTVLSAEETPGRFNPQRIVIDDLNVAVFARELSSDTISATLQRLQLREHSGLRLNNLSCRFNMSHSGVWLNDLTLSLDSSSIVGRAQSLPFDTASLASSGVKGYGFLSHLGREVPVWIEIDGQSRVFLPDLAPFAPMLQHAPQSVNIALDAQGTLEEMQLRALDLRDRLMGLSASVEGTVRNYQTPSAEGEDPDMRWMLGGDISAKVVSNSHAVSRLLSDMGIPVSDKGRRILGRLGQVEITASANGNLDEASLSLAANTANGDMEVSGRYRRQARGWEVACDADFEDFDLAMLLDDNKLGHISGNVDITGIVSDRTILGEANAQISHIELLGYDYHDISATANADRDKRQAAIIIQDDNADVNITLTDRVSKDYHHATLTASIANLDLDAINLWHKFPDHALSGSINAQAEGYGLQAFKSTVDIQGLKYVDRQGDGLYLKEINLDANTLGEFDDIFISSDILNGNIHGKIDFTTIGREAQAITATVMPQVIEMPPMAKRKDRLHASTGFLWEGAPSLEKAPANDFVLDLTLADAADLSRFFGISYLVVDPVAINGGLNSNKGHAWLSIDAPYLLNGANLQRNSFVYADIDAVDKTTTLFATTLMPTKKGDMDLVVNVDGHGNRLDTNVDWQIIRDIPINGTFDFTTTLLRDLQPQSAAHASAGRNPMSVLVNFRPGQINFGEDVWNIQPSQIVYADKMVDVDNFAMSTETQRISIDGRASTLTTDSMTVTLDRVNLLDIFETLNIDNALIGGQASGHIYANAVFSDSLSVECTDLFVKNIGYNRCTLGDGDVKVHFDREDGDFEFDATVLQPDGRRSYITGSLWPATESVDLAFDADHVRVGFMQTFMKAFASHVDGYASGHARLFGTFKDMNLEGDIFADTLSIKIDFTNTTYSASDSIHLTPGLISLKDITLYDPYGNTAKLSGWVKHEYFHYPSFDFNITDARNFLSYDVTPKESPDWYGHIFGNGGALVTGEPGVVNIGVNMSTAPNSTFTFVLSDTEEANEYSFITFRDITPHQIVDSIVDVVIVPQSVLIHQGMSHLKGDDAPTAYNMDIQVDITPQAQMNIIMDPVGGDRIRGYGAGHLRMTYGSANNDLRMYGTYRLDKGSYNFTLQDIIIKDFTIKEGSSITFTGDPYTAQLDINAIYQVNANLSDLDKSFQQDKELNRTNVPVHALLHVTGNMMQPDIDFDLEFPTLTVDTYRKVRSIVSTEEMMNMQIIYLLALNRFYTPEYMSATKGNELFSVASSTISSQLSSMLGKLSENWSIAPNLRSDRGDFSDLEVDLMLSSSLLNNRLLFNGNFGYRDKSLNTNQFVGDFDIQYLLNRSGSWSLKAYNRFNDQNYYLRTAQTTQGVGVQYRRDFDNLFSWLKKKKKRTSVAQPPATEPDTVIPDTVIIDQTSIALPQTDEK